MGFLRASIRNEKYECWSLPFSKFFSIEKVTSLVDDRGTLLRRVETGVYPATSPEPSCSKAE